MKLVLSNDEVKQAVTEWLAKKGFTVKPEELKPESHVEGQYDESREIHDGYSVEIESKP